MLNIFIRLFKFLIVIVPILVAIIDCSEQPDKPDKPPTVYITNHIYDGSPALDQGILVIDLVDGTSLASAGVWDLEDILDNDLHWVDPDNTYNGLATVYVNDMQGALQAIENHRLVEIAEPRRSVRTMGWAVTGPSAPNDPLFNKQWHMKAMGAPYGWANTPQGEGVIVAVLDTGVTVVQDLKGTNVLKGKSFVGGDSTDRHGHGTHCTGTIAQTTNNGVGTTGIAPKATILPVKVLSDGGFGSSDGIAAGIDYAIAQKAQVISMSLGGGYSRIIEAAVQRADKAGVIVVAACGNSSVSQCGYPGGLKETIGVSATGPNGKLAFYSSYGKGVDIAAPGGDKKAGGEEGGVLQNTVGKNGTAYEYYQGTSMATPHVAGAAAVLLSTGLSTEDTVKILLESADSSDGDAGKYGAGHLDLEAAVKAGNGNSGGLLNNHGGLFFITGLLALGLSVFSDTNRRFVVKTSLASATLGGGLWFLTDMPFLDGLIAQVVISPILEWPNILLWNGAAGFPLWASVAIPLLIAFVFGMNKLSRPFAAALAFAIGTGLLWAAASGSLVIWIVPAFLSTAWLTANGLASVAIAMGLCGAQHLEEVQRV